MKFTPHIEQIGKIDPLVHRSVIHDEPMLFSASVRFARQAGGPLTRMLLEVADWQLQQMESYCSITDQYVVIDTRSHMLMPGFRPAIGGWHCDAYPRGGYDEQPDLTAGKANNHHIVAFVSDQNGGVSQTEFVTAPIEASEIDPERVWSSVHRAVQAARPTTMFEQDGEVLRFSQQTLHRASSAHARGWRWWFRASVFYSPPRNQIRKQVQVYGEEGQSW